MPVGNGDLTFNAGLVGKGSRIPASIRQRKPEFPGIRARSKSYVLINGVDHLPHRRRRGAAFVNNLFNKEYFESYIERTTLVLAGLPTSDVGIIGDRRRYGVRARFRF